MNSKGSIYFVCMSCMWKSEDSLSELVFSLTRVFRSCLIRGPTAMMKHNNQKQLREETVYGPSDYSLSLGEGGQKGTRGRSLEAETMEK